MRLSSGRTVYNSVVIGVFHVPFSFPGSGVFTSRTPQICPGVPHQIRILIFDDLLQNVGGTHTPYSHTSCLCEPYGWKCSENKALPLLPEPS